VAFELLFLKTITLLYSVLSLHPLFWAKVLLKEAIILNILFSEMDYRQNLEKKHDLPPDLEQKKTSNRKLY
jgi:hypothetical protein